MHQACNRDEVLMARCIVRSKDEGNFFGWQWSHYYDGSDGLNFQRGLRISKSISKSPTANRSASARELSQYSLHSLHQGRSNASSTVSLTSPRPGNASSPPTPRGQTLLSPTALFREPPVLGFGTQTPSPRAGGPTKTDSQ